MNPLHYSLTAVQENSTREPKTTAEKINIRLDELSRERDKDFDRELLYNIQREGAEAIRILANEIDSLKLEIEALKPKSCTKAAG